MGRSLRALAFLTVLMGGYEAVLPDIGWGVRVAVAYGVFLSNVLLLVYAALFAAAGGLPRLRPIIRRERVATFVLLVVALGVLGFVSAGVNATALLDLGQAARLMLWGLYVLFVVYWSRVHGFTFALRAYLLGTAAGGLVNLVYTLLYPPLLVFGVLPVLHSSNGAGGVLATAVVLSAWLWLIRDGVADGRVAAVVTAVGLVATVLSYSKTAMLIGAIGLLGWFFVLLRRSALGAWRRVVLAGVAALIVLQIARPFDTSPASLVDLLARSFEVKFGNMTFEKKFGIDDYNITGSRYAYWPMTWRVLVDNPIFGVGYSGLYDAYGEARRGYEDLALREEHESRATNPHNSFLYYVGANGFFALVLVIWIFIRFVRAVFRSCMRAARLRGCLLGGCVALTYLIFGFTLPTLFNTDVLYLPAAVALADVAFRARVHARADTVARSASRPALPGRTPLPGPA